MRQFSTTGICECGCGGKTAQKTHWRSHNPLPGKFSRFITGHNSLASKIDRPDRDKRRCTCGGWRDRSVERCRDCWNKEGKPEVRPEIYIVRDLPRRKIPLTQGQYALVDADNYERLMKFNYYAQWSPLKKGFYAKRNICVDGKWLGLGMQYDVIDVQEGEIIDHIRSPETLDNCRDNLRPASYSQNSHNRVRGSNNTTGRKNISKTTDGKNFRVRVCVNGESEYRLSGTFEEACILQEEMVKRLHGKFGSSD